MLGQGKPALNESNWPRLYDVSRSTAQSAVENPSARLRTLEIIIALQHQG